MILFDNFESTLTPLVRLKPLYALRDGILSPLQRLPLQSPSQPIRNIYTNRLASENPSSAVARAEIKILEDFNLAHQLEVSIESVGDIIDNITPLKLLEEKKKKIIEDIELLQLKKWPKSQSYFSQSPDDFGIYIHPQANLSKLCEILAMDGPVVIDEGAELSAFTLLKGPCYIGKHTKLDKAFVYNSIIGNHCRIGGEIGDSIIGDFSNKHHEGFIGHSLVGDWVNLGALTTTSDLKNNYSQVKLKFGQYQIGAGSNKFGSIIGDFVKTAIGTMLNTGTIIDLGAQIFQNIHDKKYITPFNWGGQGDKTYELARFLHDIKVVMQRRRQEPSLWLQNELSRLHEKLS